MAARFEWNDRAVRAKLDRMDDRAKGEVLQTALMAAAQLAVNRAKELAPVQTGTLRNSITAEPFQSRGSSAAVLIGSNVEYAPYVEFGTSRQAAQAYLRPALADTADDMAQEIGRAILGILG